MIKILIVISLILLISVLMFFNKLLKSNNSYVLKNEKGQIIDANLYTRWNKINESVKVEELVLYFNGITTYEKILIIVPTKKLLGLPEGGENSFLKISKYFLIQFHKGKKFTPINNSIEELISQYYFSNEVISFNTFGKLKKYGNKIIIEKVF